MEEVEDTEEEAMGQDLVLEEAVTGPQWAEGAMDQDLDREDEVVGVLHQATDLLPVAHLQPPMVRMVADHRLRVLHLAMVITITGEAACHELNHHHRCPVWRKGALAKLSRLHRLLAKLLKWMPPRAVLRTRPPGMGIFLA